MAPARPRDPLIAVVGTTGTGKSNLAVELAKRFNGEIINSDAMQMYKGLPIITNKIPEAEREGIPHHLLDIIGYDEQPWDVRKFTRESLGLIKDIRDRGKLPILVGGTHYYLLSLLFKDLLVDWDSNTQDRVAEDECTDADAAQQWQILERSTEEMLVKLKEVDPIMANHWHPNERRKIRRSLEIWLQTGKPASQVYSSQLRLDSGLAEEDKNDVQSRSMRFPTIVFWLRAEKEALHSRLDARLDKMIQEGLIEEALLLHRFACERNSRGVHDDMTRGAWIAIGYKELTDYLSGIPGNVQGVEEKEKALTAALERIKISTRQYSKQQEKFIRVRLLNILHQSNSTQKFYLLDCTNLDSIEHDVVSPASNITKAFLEGFALPDPKALSQTAQEILTSAEADIISKAQGGISKTYTCDICDKTMEKSQQWELHLKSYRHRRNVAAQSKPKAVRIRGSEIPDAEKDGMLLSEGDVR